MANDQDPPELPPIPQLTQVQLNRLLAADWLDQLSKLVRVGSVTGFDFAWDTRYGKPVGQVQLSTDKLQAPLELKMQAAIAQEQAKIPVQDISAQIRDHACESPECIVCNNSKNAQKS